MKLTPVMQQYMEIKNNHQDSIVFFRLGDFYEMFFEDARIASRELEITLTSRDKKSEKPVPMAGVPYHSSQSYINKLIKKGYKVTICEQTTPAGGKEIVKREAVRTVTPGTLIDEEALETNANNYFLSIFYKNEIYFICYCDISTGEIRATSLKCDDFLSEIFKIKPAEILIIKDNLPIRVFKIIKRFFYITQKEEGEIKEDFLKKDKKISKSLKTAINNLFFYIKTTQKLIKLNTEKIDYYDALNNLRLDWNSQKNLELVEGLNSGKSLFDVINFTCTSMGGRELKKWVLAPLTDISEILKRQKSIEELVSNSILRREVEVELKKIKDVERIINRINFAGNSPKDFLSLRESLVHIDNLWKLIKKTNCLIDLTKDFPSFKKLELYLNTALKDEVPAKVSDGGFIKKDFSKELDELRDIARNSKDWLACLELQERKNTGIKNLKVRYNKVFGYFIEVSKNNTDKVPQHYIRKQTMVSAERYFTPELKEKEAFILGADERIHNLELKLFEEIKEEVKGYYPEIISVSKKVSLVDCVYSGAECANKKNYNKPVFSNEKEFEIWEGRHPVVEEMLDDNDFIPNDTIMDNEENSFFIITGPNMAGKSTYIRQVALIVILAQAGMFVPAQKVRMSTFKKIFTRIGAWDNLASGLSTFMVEMTETADILKNADSDSLVILDEIGRGTSTYDGLSIAWAVTEYLNTVRSFCLFATHYHELTMLQSKMSGVKNFNVAIIEQDDELVFLHKIVQGGADKSYGIHVAELAGIPDTVINRARNLLQEFESENAEENNNKEFKLPKFNINDNFDHKEQILFEENREREKYYKYGEAISVLEELKKVDINNITPLKALNKLNQLKNKAKKI
ncbi:MAG: DNA mismatch repair protein MutS [Candidatus Muiribacteriota bacterium]